MDLRLWYAFRHKKILKNNKEFEKILYNDSHDPKKLSYQL